MVTLSTIRELAKWVLNGETNNSSHLLNVEKIIRYRLDIQMNHVCVHCSSACVEKPHPSVAYQIDGSSLKDLNHSAFVNQLVQMRKYLMEYNPPNAPFERKLNTLPTPCAQFKGAVVLERKRIKPSRAKPDPEPRTPPTRRNPATVAVNESTAPPPPHQRVFTPPPINYQHNRASNFGDSTRIPYHRRCATPPRRKERPTGQWNQPPPRRRRYYRSHSRSRSRSRSPRPRSRRHYQQYRNNAPWRRRGRH